MSKNNVRIAIRDSTDSHNVAFFDNKAGIKYKSANLHRFLAGSASILTIKYNSKDIDSIRSGCKLAFRYKNRDYWLNVMSFEKKGFEVELTAYSLGLELNNETRGEHKPANAMSIAEYVGYYDPENALTIGVNEVSDKRIKLEWTGTDTILARLFSVANSFGAELDFSVELNDDYSLKRQVLNIYKKGNLGTNKVSQPVRVGKELKVINYSDNIKELRTAVRATGKDGLTIDGLNKKIYDSNKQLLYYSSGMTVYAPQSRDRFPSVGKGSNDNWIVEDLGETQYETKEALWGYLYSEIQKKSLPEITYEVEGAIEAGIGDTQTLIDDIHFEPTLYVQARVSELEDDILTGKVTKSTFINFERKYSQIADVLLKQVEALAEDAAPYIIRLSTDNGYIFKNGEGSSTITARLEKYSKDISATWKWVVDNKVVGTGDKLTVNAEQVTNTMAVTIIAYVNGNEVVRDYMTFSNSDDGVGVESIDRYFTSSDQSDGVTIEGAEWSDKPPAPTEDGKYLWAYDEITYTDGTVTTTKPAAVGANFDVDAFRAEIAEDLKDVPNREEFENKIAEELANSKAEIETQIESAKTQAESNAKEYADTINDETAKVAELANAAAGEIKADLVNVKNNLTSTSLVANNAQAAVDAAKQELTAVNTKVDSAKAELTQAKQDLTNVASDLNTAKQDLANSVDAVNTKVDSAKAELTQTKQQLTNVANDLSQAKTDLQTAVSAVDTKATNLKSDLSQAKQDLNSQAQQLQAQANAQSELTKRVSSVEKTANGTKTTVGELSKTVAQNGKDITSVTARTKVVEDDLAGTKTTLSQVKTTADSTSQKTATLETGLNGLSAKFSNLRVGGHNYLRGTSDQYRALTSDNYLLGYTGNKNISFLDLLEPLKGETVTIRSYIKNDTDFPVRIQVWFTGGGVNGNPVPPHSEGWSVGTGKISESFAACNVAFVQTGNGANNGGTIQHKEDKLEKGNIATDYSPNEADLEQKVAEYKQNADQNYASLQTTVQNLDGTVQHNKTVADQTAQGFTTRIESLETYKDGESTRANQYFELAKTETARQLTAERTAIAKDYVAKSTYTSDVTGIRNDLSATTTTANTTKTNLANYQASNDRAVANLQSNLQEANGNISSLKTKVEAVPGQITSAVSAVESKIPTTVGGRNYIRNYGLTATGWTSHKSGWSFEIIKDSTAKSGQYLKATCTTVSTGISGFYKNLFDFSDGRFFGKQMTWSMDVKTSKNTKLTIGCEWGNVVSDVNTTTNWQRFSKTFKVATSSNQKAWIFYSSNWNVGDIVYIRDVQLEDGSIATSPVPAIEDTASDITKLSSELTQTKDGITLLATKTELNTAQNELQSGINTATNKANAAQNTANSAQNKANSNAQTISTHTTQISALNSGLSAKVSQSDFNTLSGRVTTAENNITAKANELSSKITSVEGKIPTNIGTVNLVKDTGSAFVMGYGITNTTWNETKKQTILDFSVPGVRRDIGPEILPQNGKFFDFKPTKGTTYTQSIMIDTDATFNPNGQAKCSWFANGQHNHQKAYIKKVGEYSYQVWSTYTWNLENTALRAFDLNNLHNVLGFRNSGTYLAFYKPKLTTGNLPSDWSPSPEDYDDAITQAKSEIKQTADGMTLLATKTELNTAKNELQSGINTATNKANAAQNTANNAQNKANSNAQTISTHTTQISALNTGLSAKVSQTDFNTLSGRVTTAENNIIAKANELSSKITSVEGKIPTSIGGRNYIRNYGLTATGWSQSISDWSFEIIKDSTAKSGQYLKATCTKAGGNGFYKNLFDFSDGRFFGKQMTWSMDVKTSKDTNITIGCEWGNAQSNVNVTGNWQRFSKTFKVATSSNQKAWIFYGRNWNVGDIVYIRDVQLEDGSIATSPVPAIEDAQSDIAKLSSEIKQTADGITLLATKTELNTAKNELQSGINTATNKANAAQNTANNAQNKANSNAQTISTHTTQISALNTGLQAKVSQTDFNTLSGRVTTAENNIIAKANELSSKITSVEGKIPTSVSHRNLAQGTSNSWSPFVNISTNNNWGYDLATIKYGDSTGISAGTTINIFVYLSADEITVSGSNARITMQGMVFDKSGTETWTNWDKYHPFYHKWSSNLTSGNNYMIVKLSSKVTNDSYSNINGFKISVRIDGVRSGKFHHRALMVTTGDIFPDSWSPAPEDAISQINSVSSEFKQTTDAIKASVSSLDKSTVKSSSLTINADGIVMKAGKSTTDVANAIGSYFAVNQNAINLFSDKINVKGNMIVNGAITSDKIASKSINTAHLNGKIITADVISSNAVTAGAIKAGAVTTDKMSANSINGDRITSGTLDAAKIKAGSITASQIASGTITSNQIKAGGISSANIAAGAITGDKIAAGAIDANKIAANAITANMITGGKLNSTNGATSFDLNAGTLTFNNNSGYIQRVASDKVFEITTLLSRDLDSRDYLTSAFMVRKSDSSRKAGVKFTLYNTIADKPTAEANINADALILYDSKNTRLFSVHGKSTFMGNLNMPDWGDIPIAKVHGGLVVNNIGIGGHTKSLLAIVEELCKKAGILWV